MDKLKDIIMSNGYDNNFEKQEKRYIVKIKLEPLDDKKITLIIERNYTGNFKITNFIVIEQPRRIDRLINGGLEDLLKIEKTLHIENEHFINTELTPLDDNKGLVTIDNFDHIQGLIGICGVEDGKGFKLLPFCTLDAINNIAKQIIEKIKQLELYNNKMEFVIC